MKIAVVAFIACVCFVAVSANVGAFVQPEENFDYVPEDNADEILDIEAFGFKSVVIAALRTLKGVNCSIKSVFLMKAAAEQCLADLQACGGEVSKQVQNVINQMNKIISICNDIINLNTNICPSTDDSDGTTTKPCSVKFMKKIMSLYLNIKKAVSMIKKVPTTGANASDCVNTAFSGVTNTFNQFPTYITSCSQLTS